MTISIAAQKKVNDTAVTFTILFSNTQATNFGLVGQEIVANSSSEVGVIFHIKNDIGSELSVSGSDNIAFQAQFAAVGEKFRVFYWNDSEVLADNLDCFQDYMERYGLDENIATGTINCLTSNKKSKSRPMQFGNGGVVNLVIVQ